MEWEKKHGFPGRLIGGVDEVGRGCLAGPVVACALVLPLDCDPEHFEWLREVTDSKLLNEKKRERLAPLIQAWARAAVIGVAEVSEIDTINIYHASHLAMKRAIEGLPAHLAGEYPAHVLVDGNVVPEGLPVAASAVIKGDLKCLSIAAASIVAKVYRDSLMKEMDGVYPGYSFSTHKGYGTPVHQRALVQLGACAIHRRSFAPVAEVLSRLNLEPSV